jgi:glutaredoxin
VQAPVRHHVQLLVSEWCVPCRAAEEVWQQVADSREIRFDVLDMAQPEARAVAQRLALRTVPAVVIDGQLMAVGVQPLHKALELVADAPPRKKPARRFVGITLAATGRMALLSAAAYLLLAALPLALGGIGSPGALAASMHVYGLGFVAFTIFGLAEHMLPRFMGRPVRLGAAAWMQLALAHAGVIALAGGLLLYNLPARVAGSAALLVAMLVFAARMLPIVLGRDPSRPA